jgi:3-oxoacyl-[acyl-carrier protein] reductase
LITGASRGIGQAIARAFFEAGDNITTVDRRGVGPGFDDPRVQAVAGDVQSTDQVNAAFDAAEARFGPVEVLVANAGVVADGLLARGTEADFAKVVDTNLGGAWRSARRAGRSMAARRRGAIILIGSVVGAIGGIGQANYAAAKAGIVGLARAAARELGPRGVTANVIAPGFIETDMTAGLAERTRQAYLARIPAGRFGTAGDVAAAAVFVAGAPYVNGAVIPVDGGLGMGH